MGKIKPLERMVSDLKKGDIVILNFNDKDRYFGQYNPVNENIATFCGFSSPTSVCSDYIYVDLKDGSVKNTNLKIRNYEVLRRAKKG